MSDDKDAIPGAWQIVTLNGADVSSKGLRLELSEDGALSGNGPCNRYGSQYSLDSEAGISISNIFSTKRACPELPLERDLFKALQSAKRYKISPDQTQIMLGNDEAPTLLLSRTE